MKLSAALGVLEKLRSQYTRLLASYTTFFKNNEKDFKGFRKTFTPAEGVEDAVDVARFTDVVTTVDEKFDYFFKNIEFIEMALSVERTNANSDKIDLVCGDFKIEGLTSLELLKLNTILHSNELKDMIYNIPVRTDSMTWYPKEESNRKIFRTDPVQFVNKVTEKETIILTDPNIDLSSPNAAAAYKPVTSTINKVVILGKGEDTNFSGQWTHEQRAYALKRLEDLGTAVTKALAELNASMELTKTVVDVDKLMKFVLYNQ